MAAALTGEPVVLPEHPSKHPTGRPQQMIVQDRLIQLKDGSRVTLPCRVFEMPEAELIRQAVSEAAVIQAVGRARGVNRMADNKAEVWMILHDAVLPLPVDGVVEFEELEPDEIDFMVECGLVPAFSADAVKLYPGLWPTSQAARKAYSRHGLDVERNRCKAAAQGMSVTNQDIFIRESHTLPPILIRYQPKLLRAKARLALIDPAKVADARAVIEAAIGPLALFEAAGGQVQSKPQRPVLVWGAPGSNLAAQMATGACPPPCRPFRCEAVA
jgi:putative DNA primase/helicase